MIRSLLNNCARAFGKYPRFWGSWGADFDAYKRLSFLLFFALLVNIPTKQKAKEGSKAMIND